MTDRHRSGFLLFFLTLINSSVEDGAYADGKAHTRYTPSLGGFLSVVYETVPVLVWLMMALSRPFKEGRQPLPLSIPLFSERAMT